MEYCQNGSLNELISSTGALPENILKDLVKKILNVYEKNAETDDHDYFNKTCVITPNNLYFDQNLNLKVKNPSQY